MAEKRHISWLFLFMALAMEILVWMQVRHTKVLWANVPPVPSVESFTAFSLGDRQAAYRGAGLMLINIGNTAEQDQPLQKYDYNNLSGWFFLARALDPESNLVPFLASYYFGAVQDPEKLKPLIKYLEVAGQDPKGRKWRWLAQAVYLARYKLNDPDRAYELAVKLAALPDPTLPPWAKQMPAFIMTEKGDKQAAYDILVEILKTSARTMPVNEINFMKHYICTKILDATAAQTNPLCQDITW